MFMRKKEVIIRNSKSHVIVGAVDVVKSVAWMIELFIGAIEEFYYLLVWFEFFGNSVVVTKIDNYCDFKVDSTL